MTHLPATLIEAQALMFAREWIADSQRHDLFEIGYPPFHPEAGRAMARQVLKHLAMRGPFHMTDVVDWARAGWDDADFALKELIAEHANRGEAAPAGLAAYNIEALHPDRPPRPRGRKKASQFLQDIGLATLVYALTDRFGLKPMRSRISKKTTRQPSACSVVADAMSEAGMHRGTEQAVQKIWERYGPALLPIRPALGLNTVRN